MFIQECFIRNSKDKFCLIVELERMGYKSMYFLWRNNIGGSNLVCECQTWHCTDSDNKPMAIDCGENDQLFLALAALRDDTDRHQWFTDGTHWERSESELPSRYMQMHGHKATAEEIVEFFKKGENK